MGQMGKWHHLLSVAAETRGHGTVRAREGPLVPKPEVRLVERSKREPAMQPTDRPSIRC